MAKNILPENVYPTLEEPAGNEDNVARNEREGWKNAAIAAWRDEENRRTEEEKRLLKLRTRDEADKSLKSKLFLSLGKHWQRYFYQKHPWQKILNNDFTELWKQIVDTFYREPNVTNRQFILFSRDKKSRKKLTIIWSVERFYPRVWFWCEGWIHFARCINNLYEKRGYPQTIVYGNTHTSGHLTLFSGEG